MSDSDYAEFTEANFDEAVIGRDGLTVVDFWSTTCAPCRQLTKVLDQLKPDLPDGVVIGKVNADENIGLMERFGVRAMPTLLFIKGGDVVETRTGVDRRQVLKKIIETHA
ncbi:MAG: thioredoxin domain-containing protein [Alphaproteobacteria bacterium]|jgi:thioredoxin 1